MRRTALVLLLSALGVIGRAAGVQPSAEWIRRTKERIDVILGPHRAPAAPAADLPNPFRPAGKAEAETPRASTPVQLSDLDLLAGLVATLKVNGFVQIGGIPQVIINQLAYKEGDLVAARSGEDVTYLRVKRLSPTGVTLELNKVEQTIRFK